MSRAEFLKNKWTSYPLAFSEGAINGRFLGFKGTELILWKNFEVQTLQSSSWSLEGGELSFLTEGDLISISQGAIRLLAPNLGGWRMPKVPAAELQRWSLYLQRLKNYFVSENFLEVQTPTLVTCPGSEPTLDVFAVTSSTASSATMGKKYLPTSPEWHLKKALSLGYENIFELRPCFRAGEVSERHQPEFWMLEWYRSFASLQQIQEDMVSLVSKLTHEFAVKSPQRIVRKTVADLFKEYLDFEFTPHTTESQLRALGQQRNVDLSSAESIDDCFFLIFMEKIEKYLNPNELVFVEKYPPYQAALARLTSDGWGDRFEAYWKGFELANAFHELNDPVIQRERFAEDMAKKRANNKSELPADEEFFKALEKALPPSSGIALGAERLYMALFDVTDIRTLKVFPS